MLTYIEKLIFLLKPFDLYQQDQSLHWNSIAYNFKGSFWDGWKLTFTCRHNIVQILENFTHKRCFLYDEPLQGKVTIKQEALGLLFLLMLVNKTI